MHTRTPKLQMSGISKTFPGVRALHDVSFTAAAGEIVALIGVNGAGKSTLMSVLGGVHQPDRGQILIDGQAIALQSPKDAEKHRIAFIHQELVFFASQTVAENIYMSHLTRNKLLPFVVDKTTINSDARQHLTMLGSSIAPTAKMEDLSVGGRQVVELARALALGADVVIFDEPTSSLSAAEKTSLFKVIRRLKAEGKAIIYITHFLDEIMELCDTYVVLRNGEVHGQGSIASTTTDDLIKMIIGKEIVQQTRRETLTRGRPALKVEHIRSQRPLNDISFCLYEGEVLGVWGLMGSGRTELLRAMLGLDSMESGTIYTFAGDQPIRTSPSQLLRQCGYITESRHTDGLFLTQSVTKNISVTALGKYAAHVLALLKTRKEAATADRYIALLKIATPRHSTQVATLSGGNQQKVILAKWLNRNPKIMIMDEPTRGVDIGAKLEITALIKDLARSGTSTLLITSELEEMIALSDRVLVLRNGSLVGEARGDQINHATLTAMSLGEVVGHG